MHSTVSWMVTILCTILKKIHGQHYCNIVHFSQNGELDWNIVAKIAKAGDGRSWNFAHLVLCIVLISNVTSLKITQSLSSNVHKSLDYSK